MPELDKIGPFLRARLDKTAERAIAAGARSWAAGSDHVDTVGGTSIAAFNRDEYPLIASDAVHIASQDPARTLRRIEGLRKILEVHTPGKTIGSGPYRTTTCEGCGFGGPCDDPWVGDINECPVLRGLAVEFDDHPAYQASWRPA